MQLAELFQQNWPALVLLGWFAYRWWNARHVRALLPTLRSQGAVVVDVRSVAEYAGAHAPDTLNIPLAELGARASELARGVPIVLCCASGNRSGVAAVLLRKLGFAPVYNAGGWNNLLPR